MNPEQRQRLEGLAAHLARMPDISPAFDMGNWKCGSTQCAIGEGIIAGILPGMELKQHTGDGHDFNDPPSFYPAYLGSEGFVAVARYFGIATDESLSLFSPAAYPAAATPSEVAQEITDFLVSWDRQAAYYGGVDAKPESSA